MLTWGANGIEGMTDDHEMSPCSVQPGLCRSEKIVRGVVDPSVAASIPFPACLDHIGSVPSHTHTLHPSALSHALQVLCTVLNPLASPPAFSPGPHWVHALFISSSHACMRYNTTNNKFQSSPALLHMHGSDARNNFCRPTLAMFSPPCACSRGCMSLFLLPRGHLGHSFHSRIHHHSTKRLRAFSSTQMCSRCLSPCTPQHALPASSPTHIPDTCPLLWVHPLPPLAKASSHACVFCAMCPCRVGLD